VLRDVRYLKFNKLNVIIFINLLQLLGAFPETLVRFENEINFFDDSTLPPLFPLRERWDDPQLLPRRPSIEFLAIFYVMFAVNCFHVVQVSNS
jgi:hypothetical protein